MSKVFIITELNQEYNDEITTLEEGGTPEKAFKFLDKANNECERLNIGKFRGLILNEYCYSLSDIINNRKFEEEEFINEFNEIFGTSYDSDGYIEIPPKATDDQIIRLMDICTLRFYKVDAVKMAD